ncbi:MAG TPA: TadE/TadG family type IV pilus assembly protein [Kofleriaceae bacterium]|nr:TadE/TadG family type IV pilus assembly protein [Kofleriaceae bacterium]
MRLRPLHRDQGGSVYVELLVVVLPFLLLILGIAQLALLYVAGSLTQHAARRAVRAAVVVLDDDPRHYGGAPRNALAGGALASDPLDDLLAGLGLSGDRSGESGAGRARLHAIWAAAAAPLLPLSPALVDDGPSVASALGGGRPESRAAAAARTLRSALSISFPAGPGQSALRDRFAPEDLVTVRVTYVHRCAVPLARHVLCGGAPGGDAPGAGEAGGRFRVLRAEATLPNHGARYAY